jgi:hypothetical protein
VVSTGLSPGGAHSAGLDQCTVTGPHPAVSPVCSHHLCPTVPPLPTPSKPWFPSHLYFSRRSWPAAFQIGSFCPVVGILHWTVLSDCTVLLGEFTWRRERNGGSRRTGRGGPEDWWPGAQVLLDSSSESGALAVAMMQGPREQAHQLPGCWRPRLRQQGLWSKRP